MGKWLFRKKTGKKKKSDDHYTLMDTIVEIVLWIPELILLPFRLLFWIFRGLGRVIWNLFDIS